MYSLPYFVHVNSLNISLSKKMLVDLDFKKWYVCPHFFSSAHSTEKKIPVKS